jgi:hypothetical protein
MTQDSVPPSERRSAHQLIRWHLPTKTKRAASPIQRSVLEYEQKHKYKDHVNTHAYVQKLKKFPKRLHQKRDK